MNSEVKQTIREALTLLRDHYIEWVRGEWAREKVARIDAALAALDEDAWEPLTDESSIDVKTSQNPNVGLWVYEDGERISASTFQYEVFVDLPSDIRLCRKRPPAQG